jgi:hypothetical protein
MFAQACRVMHCLGGGSSGRDPAYGLNEVASYSLFSTSPCEHGEISGCTRWRGEPYRRRFPRPPPAGGEAIGGGVFLLFCSSRF